MANKVGPLIKEARTKAGYSQDALAKLIPGLSSSDISKAERGEKELTQEILKQIAKATGVTQKSLIEAAAASTYKASGSSSKSSGSSGSSSGTSMKVSAAEKKLVELYRAADSDTKKAAVALLKGQSTSTDTEELLSSLVSGAMNLLSKK